MKPGTRPESDFLQQSSSEDLYVLTEHWQSDMDFYRDELRFILHLIDRYFIWLTKEENIQQVRTLASALRHLSEQREAISARIGKHLDHLAKLIGAPPSQNEPRFRNEHAALENDISTLVRNVRELKKEVFAMTEKVIDTEKLQHLITP